MAAKDAGLSLEHFTEWSRGGANFKSDADCATAWRSFRKGEIKQATLFHAAQEEDRSDPVIRPRKTAHKRVQRIQSFPHPSPSVNAPQRLKNGAASVWENCEPATDAHPYVVAKHGLSDGLRVVRHDGSLTIMGQRVAGYLVVPVTSLAGKLCTLQFIPPPGASKKLNLAGASFGDGMFVVGDIAQSAKVFVVEGIGQAWACWRATGCAAVVCFGAGRMSVIATQLRCHYPDSKLTIVADRGKEADAEAIARSVRGAFVSMPFETPANYDANDYASDNGADQLAELLTGAQALAYRYRVETAYEIASRPPLAWLVRGVLPAAGLACMYGASGSGKSFLALDLAANVAAGKPWFGHRVKQAPVVYVALEGEAGFCQRVKAWQKHHGRELSTALRFVTQPLDIRKSGDLDDIIDAVSAAGVAGGVLVIDTLNRAAPGADENSSKDMGDIIEGAKSLQSKLEGVVLLVHHPGKDATKGLRGHSSLYASLDAAIEVTRNDSYREWRKEKTKDGEDGAKFPFQLITVEIGNDDDGEAITSCVVEPVDRSLIANRPARPKGPTQGLIHNALGDVLRNATDFGNGGAPSSRPCVQIDAAVDATAGSLTAPPDRRSYLARRAITAMVSRGIYQLKDGWIWQT